MEHFFAPVNGIRLHCVAEGRADAPLMVFVHGFPEFWYCWHGQLEEFGKDHRAVAFDLRGHNLSDKPEGVAAYRPKPLMEDLRQLIEHLQAGRDDKSCILVAHDWGGAIAWTFAAAFPQYVNKLVIINAPHTVPFARALASDPAQQEASHYMLLLRHAKAERVLEANNYERLLKMFSRTADGHCALSDEEIPLYREAWSQPGALTCRGCSWITQWLPSGMRLMRRSGTRSSSPSSSTVPSAVSASPQITSVGTRTVSAAGSILSAAEPGSSGVGG